MTRGEEEKSEGLGGLLPSPGCGVVVLLGRGIKLLGVGPGCTACPPKAVWRVKNDDDADKGWWLAGGVELVASLKDATQMPPRCSAANRG